MQQYRYRHFLLFVTEEGLPITEYLPKGHQGREIHGLITDPTPDNGRALWHALEKHKHSAESPAASEPRA